MHQHYEFDEANRLRHLKELTPRSRIAFALLCATRLLPQYWRFSERTGRGDPQALQQLAESLWQHIEGTPMAFDALDHAVGQCMDLIPAEDDGWDEETQPYAEDAAAALAYAYRAAVTSDAQEAVWASRRVYEAMDLFAGRSAADFSYAEDVRIRHPAVQMELSRQARDLDDLGQLEGCDIMQSLEALRRRAEEAGTPARTPTEVDFEDPHRG